MKRKDKYLKNNGSKVPTRGRYKKKRRNRLRNIIFSIILLMFAAACIGGIFFMGQSLKTEIARKASVNNQNSDAETQQSTISEETSVQENGTPVGDTQSDGTETGSEGKELDGVSDTPTGETEENQPVSVTVGDMVFYGGFQAEANGDTVVPSDTDIFSTNSILIDLSTDTIVAARDANARIYPASMTKILTVLVAAEHVSNLDDTFTMTSDITAYCLNNGCSAAGFVAGETIPVRDLFYGTILPSGGEAAAGLATYVAGSQEAFVELMNQKLEELGLSDTAHFTNCVGIYDDNHYCTAYDMAMILKAAVENDFCREVLSAHVYTTTLTEQNPEGLILSNWFLRRIEDKDCGGQVLCAKTGFVAQSGDCAASYGISAGGKPYICVTVNTYSSWRCIYDHVAMYKLYAK